MGGKNYIFRSFGRNKNDSSRGGAPALPRRCHGAGRDLNSRPERSTPAKNEEGRWEWGEKKTIFFGPLGEKGRAR